MNKQDLLSMLASYVKAGEISQEEIASVCNVTLPKKETAQNMVSSDVKEEKKQISATNILYVIGSVILLIGIGTLLFRFWDDLSGAIRIALTLGIGVAAYISGIMLRTDDGRSIGVATIMQIIGGLLVAFGLFVTLHEMGITEINSGWVTLVFVVLAAVYLLSLAAFRSIVFTFYSILFTTIAIYAGITYAIVQSATTISDDIYKYLTLAVGLCFLFLASYIRTTPHRNLSSVLDSFGVIGILGAIVALGGYKPTQNVIWEIVGIASVCGGLYLASRMQNSTILKTTAVFILIYIGKFTGEYFADSFGWPVALMIGGIVLIGVGYGLVIFNKKVLK